MSRASFTLRTHRIEKNRLDMSTSTKPFELDFAYRHDPDFSPRGCSIRPWFLLREPDAAPPADGDYWAAALRYRAEKAAFVRQQLQGVDRPAALRQIVRHVWNGASSDREKFDRLIHFVQQMMF